MTVILFLTSLTDDGNIFELPWCYVQKSVRGTVCARGMNVGHSNIQVLFEKAR